MNSIKELPVWETPSNYYGIFLKENYNFRIDENRIDLSVLCGEERKILKTPTTGDSTLVLRYKGKEGAVLSMETTTNDLTLLQLQGAKNSVSYQVATGISWVNLFGDRIEKLINHPQNVFEVISMPPLEQIVGLYESGTDRAVTRYKHLANILGLRFSNENLKFMRILK